jgi:hypothetical protein
VSNYLEECASIGAMADVIVVEDAGADVVWALALGLFRKERVGRCWDEI